MATRTDIKNLIANYIQTNGVKSITALQVKEIFDLIADFYRHQDDAINVGFVSENVANKSTNTSLGTSNTLYPTQNAVKVYADTKEASSNKSVDFSVVNNVKFPTTQAVQTEILARISALVDSSPATLDTLNELANALGDDPNFATTISTALGLRELLSNKATAINNGNKTSTTLYPSISAVVNNLAGYIEVGNTGQIGEVIANALELLYYNLQTTDFLGISDTSDAGNLKRMSLGTLETWLENYFELTANKITDFSVVDNVKFPTTKAVQDEINKKITSLTNFFFWATNSDVSGYLNMKPSPSGSMSTSISVNGVIDGDLIWSFATESGVPNSDFLSSGILNIHVHGQQTAGTKASKIYARIYKRTAGGTETPITETNKSEMLNGFNSALYFESVLTAPVLLSPSDRIVVKIYAYVYGSGSAPDITIYTGTDYGSRLMLPVPVSAGASLGYTAENVANKSTSTTLGTSDTLYPTQKAVKTYVDTQVGTNPNNSLLLNIFMSNNF